jgi:hypothetical protein
MVSMLLACRCQCSYNVIGYVIGPCKKMTRHRPYIPRPSPFFKLPVGFACKRGGITCPYCHRQFQNGHQVSGHLAYCQAGHVYMLGRLPLNHNPILVLDEEDFNEYLANMNADFAHDDYNFILQSNGSYSAATAGF